MMIFDRIGLQNLDRRSWQLWALAIFMIVVLAGGLALHMYTLAAADQLTASRRAMLHWMVGFCVLAILFVGYLVDRQRAIAHLRKELCEERKHNLERRGQGNKELLQTMLGKADFSDRLAMELQRAIDNEGPLSGLTISLQVASHMSESEEIFSAFGEAVKAIMTRLRGEDSIYQFTPGVFGVLLPGTDAEIAKRVSLRVAGGLSEAMGTGHRYSFEIHVVTFPEQAKTVSEMRKLMGAA